MSNLYFITGATGFIGQHFLGADRLCCDHFKGVDIRVLSRKDHSKYETVICDLQADLIPNNTLDGVDTIFHLAGIAHDRRDANEIEDLYRRVNVDATVKLAELAVKSGVKRFVFVSSVKLGEFHLKEYAQAKNRKVTLIVFMVKQSERLKLSC